MKLFIGYRIGWVEAKNGYLPTIPNLVRRLTNDCLSHCLR